jgi:hypothetical protein
MLGATSRIVGCSASRSTGFRHSAKVRIARPDRPRRHDYAFVLVACDPHGALLAARVDENGAPAGKRMHNTHAVIMVADPARRKLATVPGWS